MTPNTKKEPRSGARPSSSDPFKWHAVGVAAVVAITPVIMFSMVKMASPSASPKVHTQQVADSTPRTNDATMQLVAGKAVYKNTCAVCHGPDGEGVARLGKPLRNSAFVQDADDDLLIDLIANGRLPDDPINTTGTLMPPRGAQEIDDTQVQQVAAYLRTMQDPDQPVASIEAWDLKALALAQADLPVDASVRPGKAIYVTSCSSCHGPNGEGIENLGKAFTTSTFVANSSDKELMTMIKMGRPIWDAANTTGLDMPSKGGNPALSDDELTEIIGYMRSINTVEG